MTEEAPPPTLPTYGPPRPRECAVLPKALAPVAKMPGSLNKVISSMLPKKLGKLAKSPKLKAKLPTGKPGKKRHKVHFK